MVLPSNTVQQQGQGVQNADQMNTNVQAVTSLTALRDFTALGSMMIYLQGYSSPGDGGQGAFYFNANATGPDDGVNIIVPTGAAQGAWIRLPTSIPGLLIYATLPTGTTDTWSPIGYASPVDAIVITTDSGGSTLAGLTGGVSDRRMVLANAGPGSLTFTNGASGTAADNFILPNSASQVIPPNGALAFVYDAVNLGWRAIGNFATGGGGSAVAFRVQTTNDTAMASAIGPAPIFDTVDFDTASGISQSAVPGIYNIKGPITHYIIQQDGIYNFHVQLYFQVSPAQTVAVPNNIYLDVEFMSPDGNTVIYSFASNTTGGLVIYSPSTEGMNQFSVELTFTVNCTAGQFLLVAVDDQSSSLWPNLTFIGDFNCCFEGFKIG